MVVDSEVPSDGIFLGEELFDESLVHHGNQLRGLGIGFSKAASTNHGLSTVSKTHAHPVPRRSDVFIRAGLRASFDPDSLAPVVPFQSAVKRQPHALHSGSAPNSCSNLR